MKTVQNHWRSAFALIQRRKVHVSCLRAVITVSQSPTTHKSRMRIHAPILCLRLLTLHTCGLAVSATLLIVCRLRRAGASRGGFGGLCGFGRLGRLSGLRSLGGLVGRGAGGALRSASRATARGASCSLQSCATAAATLDWGWVLESQETRAVGDIIVGAGPVRVTLVK